MKDELIDIINKEAKRSSRILTICAYSLVGINFLLMMIVVHAKHPEVIDLTNLTFIKSLFHNFG